MKKEENNMSKLVSLKDGVLELISTKDDDYCQSIFFSGNGRMGARGYLPFFSEETPLKSGLFVAGIFGEIKKGITDFVNLPTPICQTLYIDDKKASFEDEIHYTLDLKTSLFSANLVAYVGEKKLNIEYQRFFYEPNPALLLQRTLYKANQPLRLKVISNIMSTSVNCTVPDDQVKENDEIVKLAILEKKEKAQASFEIKGTELKVKQKLLFDSIKFIQTAEKQFETELLQGELACLDKCAVVLTSRDNNPSIKDISTFNYQNLLDENLSYWEKRWAKINIESALKEDKTALMFNAYQLMTSCNRNDSSVSIGARGLSHTRYKGCYFWDTDMFMLPFFIDTDLVAAKNLCEYRYQTLEAAKMHSKQMNTKGARYPWMAALDGTEQCETWDIGCSELHITADVAYALDSYCKASRDEDFYLNKACEVYVETARFWASRYTYNLEKNECNLLFCKGPDEYCGVVNNNLFTNVMVQNNLRLAIKAANDLKTFKPELYQKLFISDSEVSLWQKLEALIPWPRDPKSGHLTTDDNFHLLEEVDVKALKDGLKASYHKVCFDRVQRMKVVKQADVILLMTRLPELFTDKQKKEAWDDFEPICLHDSSLSFASHALFAAMNNKKDEAISYLKQALYFDLNDLMNSTGKEGLHLASMGEAWLANKFLLKLI